MIKKLEITHRLICSGEFNSPHCIEINCKILVTLMEQNTFSYKQVSHYSLWQEFVIDMETLLKVKAFMSSTMFLI